VFARPAGAAPESCCCPGPVLDWIKSKGWFGDVTLGSVQFGFEITSTGGASNFTSNGFSVSAS
jgi:hypothetical protein